jgi:hypothetical protein
MKTTHHTFFCFTQKCGAEIRKKLRLLFLLESQNGLFPGIVGLSIRMEMGMFGFTLWLMWWWWWWW